MIIKEISGLGKSRYLAWIRLYVIALIPWLTMFLENVVGFFFFFFSSFKKIFFFFWLPHSACRLLVPQTVVEPMPPAVDMQSPNHWSAQEFP